MGDAFVSALVKEIVGRVTSLVVQEFSLLRGLKDDILSLKRNLDQIEVVLEDAEEKYIKQRAVELWLKDLRSTSLMVENVLDEVSTEVLLQRLHKQSVKYKVRAFFSSNHNKFMSRARIAHKVKDIRRKLDDIASKRFELKLTPFSAISHVDVGVEGEMPDRETSSLMHDSSVIFGRNEEIEMVTRTICNKDIGNCENGEIRVYAIWGMGGIGKTTLAQLVYNHQRVDQYFNLKCWVYVSENFQVKEIIKGIITSIDKHECTLTRLDVLQESLRTKLRGKKFLIVLDDVWVEENEKAKWEELSKTLCYGAEGSTIMATTRSNTTSQMMAKVGELQHELGCLSEEDSWLLFKKLAFAQGRVGDDVGELELIGREIVEKCKRLPLAVKTVGSLMWSKRSTRDWEQVNGNIIWNLQENKVLSALKLSYDNLLPHMKRCFSYCCLFPKGYCMEKDAVIQLWVSNGFIPPREKMDLYVLGEEIFNCLVWRSFFQVATKDYEYKMHDLMHDMARHVMRHDCLIIEPACNVVEIPNEVLHLSLSCLDEKLTFSSEDLEKLTSLRSIFMFNRMNKGCISRVLNHVYLRVLYLVCIELRALPESVCKLKHLTYLNLSYSSIRVLPESIMYLQNLQVLILSFCGYLCKLPKSICKIKNLKYLNILCSGIEVLPEGLKEMINLQRLDNSDCELLQHLPFGIEKLTSLQMLSRFPVSNERGAKIGELRDLNLLEGLFRIEGLENVSSLSEAKSANLKCKRNVSILVLQWSIIDTREKRPEMFAYTEEVLEGLEPNPSLKTLVMIKYMGKTLSPSWMDNLRNLVEIYFKGCKNCERIPSLGRLPNLRRIQLSSMDSLKSFHDDDINMSGDTTDMFHSLQRLDITWCTNLVSLPSNLPKLEVLKLEWCGKLVSVSTNLPQLEVLKLECCDNLISLPDNIANIRKLKLVYCFGLLSLPDNIQSFKYLNKLVIRGCKHLSKRCKRETGVDWTKISHIPNIKIYSPSSLETQADDDDGDEEIDE